MKPDDDISRHASTNGMTRRRTLKMIAAGAASAVLAHPPGHSPAQAQTSILTEDKSMNPQAFVYTELQISVPFDQAPWQEINASLLKQPGLLNKNWLSGTTNDSIGGIYAFDSIENAQNFVTGYFPAEAGKFGVAHNTRIFDAAIVAEASRDMNSPHFGAKPKQNPGALVYTEVQVSVPFETAPWQERNPALREQTGLLSKTWLSGLHTHTLGGIDAFDTLENAKSFAVDVFPKTARKMKAAFYTRVFDADTTEAASRQMRSPYYA